MMESGQNIDWGTGEALAFATLISDGYNIRFTGEDVERGTFSHRHAVLTDQSNGNKYIPINNIGGSGKFYIANSLLSEFAVLGYEYGYAISNSKTLTIWEAQFGDFANGAQIIIDQYIAAAESKWGVLNNLVLLLPHGYEGQGPEHSSARLERFLQLSAQNNLQVCNCTTPASIFHLLRRQVMQDVQKPLVVMTPKSLLRHKLAVSTLDNMDVGREFQPVIEDDLVKDPSTIIFCSGKVYYDLLEYREEIGRTDTAIVRIEQLYPFPISKVAGLITSNCEIVWCQEEPENMGAFGFVRPIFEGISGKKIKYAGRKAAASPAVGFTDIHKAQLAELLSVAFNNKN
jgi:2-oxoglutarate dehydrogenase E1 component